jgi:hypothetical protein
MVITASLYCFPLLVMNWPHPSEHGGNPGFQVRRLNIVFANDQWNTVTNLASRQVQLPATSPLL